ncbi:tobamovirus multiplication protein 1-like isoform x1 [Anaeramoeba flamelloides]|uniref:Tobamovirus multiplication protein 1-like isoform x1 n=1 Tax=Anaeramoeba flamelloides TaxID=1746091 RepID=A0AAV7Y5Y1_9EUKA|nr:tobamovirus multiplication protein 1-like isoform x1 [Anaeramoeba flamelloides]
MTRNLETGILVLTIILIPLYFFIFFFAAKRGYTFFKSKDRLLHEYVFVIILMVVCLMRIIILIREAILEIEKHDDVTGYQIISAFAGVLFIAVFLTLTFSIAQLYYRRHYVSLLKAQKATRIVTVIFGCFVLILFIVALVVSLGKESNYEKELDLELILGIAYAICGIGLFIFLFLFVRSFPKTMGLSFQRLIQKIVRIIFICMIFYVARIIVFISVRFLRDQRNLNQVLSLCVYFLSEIIPSFLLLKYVYGEKSELGNQTQQQSGTDVPILFDEPENELEEIPKDSSIKD